MDGWMDDWTHGSAGRRAGGQAGEKARRREAKNRAKSAMPTLHNQMGWRALDDDSIRIFSASPANPWGIASLD